MYLPGRGFMELIWVIPQIRPKPAFDFGDGHGFALGVILDLIARDAIDREVAGLRVGEVEAGDAGGGKHGEVFGELDAGL